MVALHQSDDHGIFDGRIGEQHILDIFRVDIQAIGKHDQVFLTPFQIQVSFLVHRPQVTCMIPAILESGSRGLRILPVAERHVWSLDQ